MQLHAFAALRRTPLLALLASFTMLHVLALGLFARGFLLTRVEVVTRSSCSDASEAFAGSCSQDPADHTCSDGSAPAAAAGASAGAISAQHYGDHGVCNGGTEVCWQGRHFQKSAWVIIDALRFDFVACDGRRAPDGNCRSRMPRLLKLAQSSVGDLLELAYDENRCTISALLPPHMQGMLPADSGAV